MVVILAVSNAVSIKSSIMLKMMDKMYEHDKQNHGNYSRNNDQVYERNSLTPTSREPEEVLVNID